MNNFNNKFLKIYLYIRKIIVSAFILVLGGKLVAITENAVLFTYNNYIVKFFRRKNKARKLLETEVYFLKLLSNFEHFPQISSYNLEKSYIKMHYAGKIINERNLPSDWNKQFYQIVNTLLVKGIIYLDVKVENILVDKNIINLIDFGKCSISSIVKNINEINSGYKFSEIYFLKKILLDLYCRKMFFNQVRNGYNYDRNYERIKTIYKNIYFIENQLNTIFDYGSNFGYFSTSLASVFKNCQIFSIESQKMEFTKSVFYRQSKMLKFHRSQIHKLNLKNNFLVNHFIDDKFFKELIKQQITCSLQLMMSFIHWLNIRNFSELCEKMTEIFAIARITIIEFPVFSSQQHNGQNIVNWYNDVGIDNPKDLVRKVLSSIKTKIYFREISAGITYRPIFLFINPSITTTSKNNEVYEHFKDKII